MSITVQIPTALRPYAGNQDTLELDGATVGEAMQNLAAAHPRLKAHLFNESGALRNFVNVYLNDEDIRYLQQADTALKDGDVLTIVPAVAGGLTTRRTLPVAAPTLQTHATGLE